MIKQFHRCIRFLIVFGASCLTACGAFGGGQAFSVADINGLVRIEGVGRTMDFVVSSGLSGEKLPGARLSLADVGGLRLLYAEDPTGSHLPLATPLAGESTVRRVVLAPLPVQGFNIATASGDLDVGKLNSLGALSESALRDRLKAGKDTAVLIYLYNPQRPLALTGASLDAYGTPYDNVTVLKAGAEPTNAVLSLVIIGIGRDAYETWSNLAIDRYLAARIGSAPDTDVRDDLAFEWAYPVVSVYPSEDQVDLGEDDSVTFQIAWRSQNPDPPPPWTFFVSSDNEALTLSTDKFPLKPGDPPQDLTATVSRANLAPGDYTATLTIQPFSDTFGLIEQLIVKEITFTVIETPPTPTPGPQVKSMTVTPENPQSGDVLTIEADGFLPGERVTIELSGQDLHLTDSLPLADALGAITAQVDLATAPPGDYLLTVIGEESKVSGTKPITIAGRPPDAIVNSSELNVRLEPFPDSPVLEILVQGDELRVIAVNGDNSWMKVITPTGIQGWVQSRLCTVNIDLNSVPWDDDYPTP
jgi:hypothetical protein